MSSVKESRSLTFSEGSSNKFWKIELDGSSHTVCFGKVGTSGQTQTKVFADEAAARKTYDKLVAEKLKKGYVDAVSSSGSTASATPAAAKSAAPKAPSKKAETPIAAPQYQPMPATSKMEFGAEREIALDPEDWFRAGFRPRKRLERSPAKPFDKEDCVRRLAKLKTTTYGWDARWQDLDLPSSMSREEAHFWLVAMTRQRHRDNTMQQFADNLAKEDFNGKLDPDSIHEFFGQNPRGAVVEALLPIATLLSVEPMYDLITKPMATTVQHYVTSQTKQSLLLGFRRYVLPFLTDDEVERLRKRIRDHWDPTQDPGHMYAMFPADYYLAACLGMSGEVYEVVSRWPDDKFYNNPQAIYADHYQRPQSIVFGLGSAAEVEQHWRRLKLKIRSTDDARGLLACTEYAALDCLADDIIAETNKEKCAELLEILLLVRAPEAAEPILRCKMSAKTPAPAREWLDKYVGQAAAGLIEPASGRGALAEAALDYLREVKRYGHSAVIAAALEACPNKAAAARVKEQVLDYEEKVYPPLDETTTPKWLTEALAAVSGAKPKKLPGWASPAQLPPLIVGDHKLNDEQVAAVMQLIVNTTPGTAHPLLAAIKANVDRHVRDAFVWKVYQNWQADGFPSTGKWALGAVGHIGDDGCVLKLTPVIRAWPGESQHARAVFGLECLRAVGSSVALMQLSGIAQKLKFKGLKAKAEQFVEEIAKEKGLTRAELEDRVVPDCGLDVQGRREFSFGPRAFSFVLAGDLKAMVRDGDGKLRTDLPKPSGKDDEAAATASVEEWKPLKKQIKQVATVQAERLERAMVAGRRWAPADFETLLVRHPLMTHLTQKLIWGAYDDSGKRQATFRVTEERDFANVEENRFDLKGIDRVGVIHPLEMTEEERNAWGQVLGDYEIITPFPQLGRKTYSLEAGEESLTELTRFKGIKVVAPTMVGILEKLGWTRGTAMDAGCFDEHSKQFPAADVTAVVHYEGAVGMGYIDPNETLTLDEVYFCSGMRAPSGYGWHAEQKLPLGKVSPVVMSEVLAHMHVLKSKAK